MLKRDGILTMIGCEVRACVERGSLAVAPRLGWLFLVAERLRSQGGRS